MTQKQNIMRYLGVNEKEAEAIIASDRLIDRGGRTEFDLSPEEEKRAIKEAHKGTREKKPTNYNFTKRERKEDSDKRHLMEVIEIAIGTNSDCEGYEITNPEREMTFVYRGRKFKITLSAPRT